MRELGDRFERLMRAYLTTDPMYAERFEHVWLWQDWPGRGGKADTGIDLVAAESDGGICAIQCKFYDAAHTLEKADIDSFFTASGKTPFTSRLIVSTTDKWTKHAEDALDKQQIPVTRLRVRDLADSPIDWSTFVRQRAGRAGLAGQEGLAPAPASGARRRHDGPHGRRPRQADHGLRHRQDVHVAADRRADRGTRGRQAAGARPVPGAVDLAAVADAAGVDGRGRGRSCGRSPSAPTSRSAGDSEDISRHDLAFPATTNADKLLEQIAATASPSSDDAGMTVVFSTYQSIDAINAAQKQGLPEFDLIICDEAHRTTGVTLAGERRVALRPRARRDVHHGRQAPVHDRHAAHVRRRSEDQGGRRAAPSCARWTTRRSTARSCTGSGFGEAVEQGLLTDYKVLVLAVDEEYVAKTFQHQLADENSELQPRRRGQDRRLLERPGQAPPARRRRPS